MFDVPSPPVRFPSASRPTPVMNEHFDVIIIGTGAGGGTLLHRLAASGKRILILERGPFLPREKDNWNYHGSFKYYSPEVMFNKDGGEIRPGFSYHVGGNTKVYGAALFRLREKDFESFQHRDGISPGWPIKYRDWEDYYSQAEKLYEVHGKAGEDPTEPWRAKDYPFPPVSHEPRIAEVFEILKARGLKPYPAPMGVHLNEAMKHLSPCIRCDTCDGYPCLVGAKSDAEVMAVRPALFRQFQNHLISTGLQPGGRSQGNTSAASAASSSSQNPLKRLESSSCFSTGLKPGANESENTGNAVPTPNITLLTEAKVLQLQTNVSGREVTGVVAQVKGETRVFRGDIVVVACGAVNSAALLLRSANDRHPRGLANNSSGLVGRNLMKHVLGSLIAVTNAQINPSKFQKTMAINDFYWGEPGYDFPMGNIQLMGKTVMDGLVGQEARYAPLTLEEVAKCSVDWWLTTEDLPDARNQVRTDGDKIVIDYTENNSEPFARLNKRWETILREIDSVSAPKATTGYFQTKMPMHSLGHQVGTCKFGEDPATSVLDLNCRAHDVDNLYVVDGSFFVSSGAVNPTLTIVANALRVGDHLLERLGANVAADVRRRTLRHEDLRLPTSAATTETAMA
jgi:choline dehydrogenase-like flavoprotein